MYVLKKGQPAFEVVDGGDMVGHRFTHGVEYPVIPQKYKNRFEKVKKKPVKPEANKGGGKE